MKDNTKSSLQLIKNNNKNLILSLIHKSNYISRAELKRITGLSPTTVSSLVDELIESGFVTETGPLETGNIGRKAVSIEINPSGMYFAGIEIESERTEINIYNLRFKNVYSKDAETGSYDEILSFLIKELKNAENMLSYHISSIVIGVSGIIDKENNKILFSTVMDLKDADFLKDIKKSFPDTDVILQNSSALIAFAEKEARCVKDLVTVDIGSGVGAGIIIDGKIYTGAGGTAGEFGHISIDMHGEKCECGNFGCTELYTNTKAIRKKAALILGKDKVSLKTIKEEAENNNPEIIKLIKETAEILSFALVGLVNMMAPESIVISGKITELSDCFLKPLKDAVSGKCSLRETKIEFSTIKENTVTLGGAKLAFDKMLDLTI